MLRSSPARGEQNCSPNCTVSGRNCSVSETAKLLFRRNINDLRAKAVWRNESAETASETAFPTMNSTRWSSLAVWAFSPPYGVCVCAPVWRAHTRPGDVVRASSAAVLTEPRTHASRSIGSERSAPASERCDRSHHRRHRRFQVTPDDYLRSRGALGAATENMEKARAASASDTPSVSKLPPRNQL